MCTDPKKGFKFGKTINGKDRYYIRNYNVHHLEYDARIDKIITCYDNKVNYSNTPIHEYVEIPCGKCLECKLDYSRQWAIRCLLESKQYEKNCFITLTYNDDFLPRNNKGYKTLVKRDFQLFMKRLRKELEPLKIRYFACGEYGEESKRPHYHAIIFNWFPSEDDLTIVGKNFKGDIYYSSKLLEKLWTKKDKKGKYSSLGFNVVANADYNSMAYVTRYVTKKTYDYKELYDMMNIENEFTLMSRKPGIGSKWYDDNKSYANFTKQFIGTDNDSITISSVRYYDKKLANENAELYENVKNIRKEFAENRKKIKLNQTSLDYQDLLNNHDKYLSERTKILKRKGV